MEEHLYQHIENDPAFSVLRKRRAVFNWSLALIMLVSYYTFICVIAFAPELLARPLHEETVITWAIPVGFSVIVLSLVLTGVYVVRSNREFDPALQAIIDNARHAAADEERRQPT